MKAPSHALSYISIENVELDCPARDPESVIRRLASTGVGTGQVADVAGVVEAAMAREARATTAVGGGLAIPHAKTDAAASPLVAFARLQQGVDWTAPDGVPVDMAFLISVPESTEGKEHLKILAALARALAKEDFRNRLRSADTASEVLDILAERL
jgi:PTS system fructose-specific IIC component